MIKHARALSLAAVLFAMLFALQGCLAPSASHSAGNAASSASAALETLPAVEPTASSPERTLAPENTPSAAPEATAAPRSQDGFACNAYSATDGSSVYYFSGNSIHSMSVGGTGDRDLKIKDFYQFLAVNGKGVYYLVYDSDYQPVDEENDWQYCNSYNLMYYNKETRESTALKKHLYDAVRGDGSIYMIDHLKHSHILRYDITAASMSDVSGLPADFKDYYEMNLMSDGGKPYVVCGSDENSPAYLIAGDSIDTKTKMPEKSSGAYAGFFSLNYSDDSSNGAVASYWTGSSYQVLDLQNVMSAFDSGSSHYVATGNFGEADDNGNQSGTVALYQVSEDGTVTKLLEKQTKNYEEEGGNAYEVAGGWFFYYWVDGDGGTVSELFFKQKI